MSLRAVRLPLLCFLVTCFLVAMFPRPAHAQVLYGSVTGSVMDQTGAVVPGAQVTITNDATGLKRQATTDPTGRYRVLDLPEGTYTIDVSASGFRPLKKTNITVIIGQVNEQDLQLEVGALTQEVTVQGTAAVLQTQKADVHTTISSYAVENLPVNVYRNFQMIEVLAPGVFSDSAIKNNYPNSPADTPDRSLSINTNGLPERINTTRVDGATNIFVWLPNHMLVVPPIDTIQEVNVQTSTFDVEKGLTAGAATDVVTKSGTNEIHGTLYGFHTDQALDARNLFYYAPKKGKHIINNDGATLGGPIKKNKLFFFGNWDLLAERTAEVIYDLIPPMNYRGGDFNSALGLPLVDATGKPITVCTTEGATVPLQQGMVFDPATGDPNTAVGRCVFSSGGKLNVIPQNRLNQGAQNYWALLPAPNMPGPFTSTITSNYFGSKVADFTRNEFTAKIDWNRSDRHTIWGKWTGQNFNYNEPFDFPEAGGSGAGPNHQFAQTLTIGHTWTMSPNLVLTGHLGFTRMSEHAVPPGYGKPLGISVLGIPGTNEPQNDIRYSGLPGLDIGNYTWAPAPLGSSTCWVPVTRNDWTLTTSHNLTKIQGKHEFRMGVDISHNHLNHFQPEIKCCPRGNIYFFEDNTFLDLPADPKNPDSGNQLPVFTQAPCPTGVTANGSGLCASGFASGDLDQNAVAEMDLGYMSEVQKSEQFIKSTGKYTQFGLYFGDRWKVTPKFTADLGIRWEYFPLITRDGSDKFEVYDPTTNTLSFGGIGGNPAHLGVTSSHKLFAPRIGLAYRFSDKLVVRSGYGISYDTLPLERPLRGFYPLAIGEDDFIPSSPTSTYIPYDTFAQGIPLIQNPDISQGKITPPPDVVIGTIGPGEFKRAYLNSWNLFVERQLPGQFLLNVGYVGNSYIHELNGRPINDGTFGGGSASQPLAKYGRYTTDTYQFQGYLNSHYSALQVTLQRHTYKGLFMQGSYTYSHAIGYTNDNSWENALTFNCLPSAAMPNGCQAHNRGAPGFDHTQMFKMAYVYELPLGAGKKWANTDRVARAVLGGWQLNGIFSAWGGDPLTLSGPNRTQTPGNSNTPDQIAPVHYTKGTGPGQFWFDPASFVPVEATRFGTMGRGLSWLRGPGLVQMDLSLFRHFKIKERWDVEMRLETQNLTNSPHFWDPNTSCSDVNGKCGGGFGQITSSYGERIVQIGAKVKF
jgi:hypothetical protein